MTEDGAAFQPGTEEARVPFRPRGTYAGYRAFGSGNGAVLIDPKVTRELRTAAEFATAERRITGGLLYGRGWADEQGVYLVISGYEEAGPGENSDDRVAADGYDRFTLSAADLRLLREDASRMYSGDVEAGWWRSLAGLGEFGPQDFETQAELVGPGGVGLLVYGSSVHWGTAYLGPDSQAPDSAGTLAATPAPRRRHRAARSRRRARRPGTRPGTGRRTARQARSSHRSRCRPAPTRRRHRRTGHRRRQRQHRKQRQDRKRGRRPAGRPGGGQPPFASPREGG